MQFPEISVELYSIENDDGTMDQNTLEQRLAADLMAGKGPDLILYHSESGLLKKMRSGVYRDLGPWLEKDGFDRSEYNSVIMDAGLVDGKQVIFPLYYSISTIHSTKQILEQNGIEPTQCGTWLDMNRQFADALERNPNIRLFNWNGPYSLAYINSAYPSLQTSEEIKALETDSAFREYMDFSKQMWESDQNKPEVSSTIEDITNAMRDGVSILSNASSIMDASVKWNAGLNTIGEQIQIPVRNSQGKITANVNYYAAIRGNSSNAEAAYELFKMLLPKLMAPNLTGSLPVKNEAALATVDAVQKKHEDTENPFPSGFFEEYKGFLSEIDSAVLDFEVYNLLIEYFMPYVQGESSYEDCMKKAMDGLIITLSE